MILLVLSFSGSHEILSLYKRFYWQQWLYHCNGVFHSINGIIGTICRSVWVLIAPVPGHCMLVSSIWTTQIEALVEFRVEESFPSNVGWLVG